MASALTCQLLFSWVQRMKKQLINLALIVFFVSQWPWFCFRVSPQYPRLKSSSCSKVHLRILTYFIHVVGCSGCSFLLTFFFSAPDYPGHPSGLHHHFDSAMAPHELPSLVGSWHPVFQMPSQSSCLMFQRVRITVIIITTSLLISIALQLQKPRSM